ncbi:MAG: uroporphyrinogen-III synthase [Euryarchaeota archaeon]|nr:uroporphyrinogen-III synthase [Euryarchaeota archaeon]
MQTLAIIRPERQLEDSKKVVESFGYRALAASMVDITPISDSLWSTFIGELAKGEVDYLILTSANGARICAQRGLNATSIPKSTRVVAIGPATRSALLKDQLRVDLMPSEYSSHGIVRMLSNIAEKKIWVLRSAYGSPELIEGLKKGGAAVYEVVLYTLKKRCGPSQRDFIREVTEGDVAGVLFTSAMTVKAFFDCADRMGTRERLIARLAYQLVGAIGTPTADALRACNVKVDVIPKDATFGELVSAVHSTLKNRAL